MKQNVFILKQRSLRYTQEQSGNKVIYKVSYHMERVYDDIGYIIFVFIRADFIVPLLNH